MNFEKVKFLFILVVFTVMSGCSTSKLIITSEFLICNNFKDISGFKVIQIFPKGSLIPPTEYTESTEFRYASLTDSSFKWKNHKVFFNKSQQGFKWVPLPLNDTAWVPLSSNSNVDTIGNLKNNSWYLFKGLHNFGYLYYVYIDSLGAAKMYEINKSNY